MLVFYPFFYFCNADRLIVNKRWLSLEDSFACNSMFFANVGLTGGKLNSRIGVNSPKKSQRFVLRVCICICICNWKNLNVLCCEFVWRETDIQFCWRLNPVITFGLIQFWAEGAKSTGILYFWIFIIFQYVSHNMYLIFPSYFYQ